MKLRINIFIPIVVLILTCNLHAQSYVIKKSFFSETLGINKSFYIYLPDGYDKYRSTGYPVVYFLRLRAAEMFEVTAPGRNGKTLRNVADSLYENGLIGKMIIVCPSTGGTNGWAGLVNMLRPDLSPDEGIGTGLFEDYFFDDLIPHIDAKYNTIPDREHRGIDGFSWGGYTSIVYALRNPGKFCSVGSYEAPLMWYNLDDPDIEGNAPDDSYWVNAPIPVFNDFYSSVFGTPRDIGYMLQHNATNLIVDANEQKLDSLRSMSFHIQTKLKDPNDPIDFKFLQRNRQLVDSMAVRGIYNSFQDIVLTEDAVHNYAFADLHASKSLIKHWESFQQVTHTGDQILDVPSDFKLFQNYPNPFNPSTTIKYSIPVEVNSQKSIVNLKIFDLLGREVSTLVNSEQSPGDYEVNWDASGQASGVYFFKLTSGSYSELKKMVLLR